MSDVLTVTDAPGPNSTPDHSFAGQWLDNWLTASTHPTLPDVVGAVGGLASYGFSKAAAYGLSEAEAKAADLAYQPADLAMNSGAGTLGVAVGAKEDGTFGFLRDMSALTGSWGVATAVTPEIAALTGLAVIAGLPEEAAIALTGLLVVGVGYEASKAISSGLDTWHTMHDGETGAVSVDPTTNETITAYSNGDQLIQGNGYTKYDAANQGWVYQQNADQSSAISTGGSTFSYDKNLDVTQVTLPNGQIQVDTNATGGQTLTYTDSLW